MQGVIFLRLPNSRIESIYSVFTKIIAEIHFISNHRIEIKPPSSLNLLVSNVLFGGLLHLLIYSDLFRNTILTCYTHTKLKNIEKYTQYLVQ